jgi:hypothetical protein
MEKRQGIWGVAETLGEGSERSERIAGRCRVDMTVVAKGIKRREGSRATFSENRNPRTRAQSITAISFPTQSGQLPLGAGKAALAKPRWSCLVLSGLVLSGLVWSCLVLSF